MNSARSRRYLPVRLPRATGTSPRSNRGLGDSTFGAPVTFVPHLLPLDQGLLASCYVDLAEPLDAAALAELYTARYADQPFVEVVDTAPGVREVRDTNLVPDPRDGGRTAPGAAVFAAIDNLWKGASGQAVQNLNLLLGLDETEGLLESAGRRSQAACGVLPVALGTRAGRGRGARPRGARARV